MPQVRCNRKHQHLLCIQSFIVHSDFPEWIAASQLHSNPKAITKIWQSVYPQRTHCRYRRLSSTVPHAHAMPGHAMTLQRPETGSQACCVSFSYLNSFFLFTNSLISMRRNKTRNDEVKKKQLFEYREYCY